MNNPRDSDRPPSRSEGEFEIQVEKVFARPEAPDPIPSIPKTKKEKASAEFEQEKDLRGAGRLDFVKRSGAEHFTRPYTRATSLPIPDELEVDLSVLPLEEARIGEPTIAPPVSLPTSIRPVKIDTPPAPAKPASVRRPPLLLGVASLLLLAMGYSLYRWVQEPRVTSISAEAASLAPKVLQARQALDAFLSEPSWEGRLEHILEPERLRGKVREYYEVMNFTDPEWNASLSGRREVMGTDVWYVFSDKGAAQNSVNSFRLKETNSGFKLDWESLVGPGEMPWEYFCEVRPTEPKRISVEILPGGAYGSIYADDKKFQAYELRSTAKGPVRTGYVERTARIAQKLQKATAGQTAASLTLQLVCDPNSDASQVKILDIATDPLR